MSNFRAHGLRGYPVFAPLTRPASIYTTGRFAELATNACIIRKNLYKHNT